MVTGRSVYRLVSVAALVVLGITVPPTASYAITQGGQCNSFEGAGPLGSYYNDGRVLVPACGPRPNFGGATLGVHPYPGSLVTPGYQCVELSERYLYYAFGVTMGTSTNGDQIVDHYAGKYPNMFSSISNGAVGRAPVQGDVLSFSSVSGFNSSSGGHTAVVQSSTVSSAGNGQLQIIEENASASGSMTVGVSGWRVNYNGYPYVKWLHSNSGGSASTTGYEMAFEANTGNLWSVGSDNHGDWQQGMMPGTNPSITALTGGGYEMAFQANTGSLITIGAAGNKNWQLGMMPGTSPSITTLGNGSFEVAFQANTGNLWSVGSDNHGDWQQGMMPGTNPSITALTGGGYEMAFQANTGSLITIGAAGNKNWQLGMMPGTSPSITTLGNGSFEVAFQANTGNLWSVGSDNHGDWQQGMMPGTNPSITALTGGGYEMAFQANTGSLITIGAAGNKNWQLGMMPGTSPSITTLGNGSFEVAFQANTGNLWSVGSDNHGDWGLGMKNQTSPSIAP